MGTILKNWLLGIIGAAMLGSAAVWLTPDGTVKKILRLLCGFVMLAALISVGTGFDYNSFSKNMARYKSQAEAQAAEAGEAAGNLQRLIIEEETEAYILDKAEKLGAGGLEIAASAEWNSAGYWYPAKVKITGDISSEQQEKLSFQIESDIGIAGENLVWSTDDEG